MQLLQETFLLSTERGTSVKPHQALNPSLPRMTPVTDGRLVTYLKPNEEVLSKKVTSLWYPLGYRIELNLKEQCNEA
jgi:hypothetical protein